MRKRPLILALCCRQTTTAVLNLACSGSKSGITGSGRDMAVSAVKSLLQPAGLCCSHLWAIALPKMVLKPVAIEPLKDPSMDVP